MLLEYLGAMLSPFGGGRLGHVLWQGEDALQIKIFIFHPPPLIPPLQRSPLDQRGILGGKANRLKELNPHVTRIPGIIPPPLLEGAGGGEAHT